jgi:hypothetical protein
MKLRARHDKITFPGYLFFCSFVLQLCLLSLLPLFFVFLLKRAESLSHVKVHIFINQARISVIYPKQPWGFCCQ